MELRGDFQIVVLRSGTTAERAEIKPDDAASPADGPDLPGLDLHHRILVLGFCQLGERLLHGDLGRFTQRTVVQLHVGQGTLTVVRAVVHVDDLQPLLEQLDGRENPVAMQSVRVQAIGVEVGGGHETNARLEQSVQQPVQDHRVGDVGHVELVEADELVTLGDTSSQFVQRIDRALQLAQLAVHLAHELVEVQPRLAPDRNRVVEAVHQEALAAPHPAVHVDPSRDLGFDEHLLERIGALLLVVRPVDGTPLQRSDGALLGGIGGVTALGKRGVVGGADRQGLFPIRSSGCACPPPARLPWSTRRATGARGRCGRCPRRMP